MDDISESKISSPWFYAFYTELTVKFFFKTSLISINSNDSIEIMLQEIWVHLNI